MQVTTSEVPRSVAARLVVLVAALFSIACVLTVGHKNPSGALIALFVLWVFVPFAILALFVRASGQWAPRRRRLLRGLTAFVCAASAAVYGIIAFVVATPKPAFWFLITPLASLCAIAIVYLAALRTRTE